MEYAVWEGVEGMLEDDTHFWKLSGEEYSSSIVAELLLNHQLTSPLPQLKDAGDAVEESAAASASAHHLPESHSSDEEVLLRPDP